MKKPERTLEYVFIFGAGLFMVLAISEWCTACGVLGIYFCLKDKEHDNGN